MSDWNISAKDQESYARRGATDYRPTEDSTLHPDVPPGVITPGRLESSAVYPGNAYDYWIYTPANHDRSVPADLLVGLDGQGLAEGGLHLTTVLDNLIHRGELPPMVGVFVGTGAKGPGDPIYGGSDHRSIEYDSMGDRYARFLLEDLLPVVERDITLTQDPERRGVLGASSGGAAAFTVAWERPDAFRRVCSGIGSFVNIRGAHQYPSMIRRAERKPIRVFLQAGSNDLDTLFGSWPIANQDMAAALAYRDYDHRFEFGDGGHEVSHLTAILPEALRWLWRDE